MQRETSPLRPPSDETRESSRRQLIQLFCDNDSEEDEGGELDSSPDEIHESNDWIRSRLAQELLESERKYVESLEMLVRTFGPVVEDRLKEISPALADLIRIIHVITGLNRRFLDEFSIRMQSWNDEAKIGDVFLAFAPFLRMYSSYATQHQDGTRVLHDLRQKGYTLSKLISGISTGEWRTSSLESFLILPVQRLPRYQLLFQQLSKRTPPDHPDFQNLQNASKQAASVAGQINEAVRNKENCFKMLEIQNRFVGEITLLAPHRRLIRSGTLVKVCRSTKKSREFFLFNDMLIYARNAPGTLHGLKLNRQILIDSSFEVFDSPSTSHKFPFEIRSSVKSFMVLAPTQENKVDWMLRMIEVVDEYRRRMNTHIVTSTTADAAPIWQPNDHSNVCSVCSNQFNVLFRRRHHCRRCGALVCGNCSRNRTLNSHAGSLDRICRVCVSQFRCFSSSTSSCTPSRATSSAIHSGAGGDDDFSSSSSFREGRNSYAGDPALQALADEAIATVRRMSAAHSYRSLPEDFRPRSQSAAGSVSRTRRNSIYESVGRNFMAEASRSFRRFSISRMTSSRRPGVFNAFNSDCALYLRAIMPRTINSGPGLDFEIGDLIAVEDFQNGEICLGVNVRTQKRGQSSLTDMIELGHVTPGHYGCPGVANTAFDVGAYQIVRSDDPQESVVTIQRSGYQIFGGRDINFEQSDRLNGGASKSNRSRASIPRNLLSLFVGHPVEVVDARSIEWWSGYNSAGEFGWFPAEYVTLACNPPSSSSSMRPSCRLCSCTTFVSNVFDSSRCARCQHPLAKHEPSHGSHHNRD